VTECQYWPSDALWSYARATSIPYNQFMLRYISNSSCNVMWLYVPSGMFLKLLVRIFRPEALFFLEKKNGDKIGTFDFQI
jgi:hypothetical protein